MDIVFALSLLLTAGFTGAMLARLLRLPSVTGYILAGVVIGPSGLKLIPAHLLESGLNVFTNIALMLVAFGIGERFDLQQLRRSARAVARVSLGESLGAFVLVAVAVGLVTWYSGTGQQREAVAIALVTASIAVATAPAATVAVIREMEAAGPLSRLVLANIVVNNALSITLFGLTVAAAKALLGTAASGIMVHVPMALLRTVLALALGLALGLATDLIVHRLTRRHDVLVVSLAAVFFCGGFADYLGLSPLLAGVAAGFTVVNRDRRDVRAFRALNDFEPPLYGLFFALAGVELHLQEMWSAGAIGLAFVLARAAGKYVGAWLGARSARMRPEQGCVIGLGLLPQAGLAIGLAYLVRQDPALEGIRATVINVVVASVVVNELLGPPLVKLMLQCGGELGAQEPAPGGPPAVPTDGEFEVVPWTWPRLKPPVLPDGHVVAAVSNPATAPAVVRLAILLSHHYGARPLALHVVSDRPAGSADDFWTEAAHSQAGSVFRLAEQEAANLGYRLDTDLQVAEDVAEGILRSQELYNAQAIVLGHPAAHQAPLFGRVVEAVAHEALCPVVVLKLRGALHTERILVVIRTPEDFAEVRPLVCALAGVMEHQITVMRLLPPETSSADLQASLQDLAGWTYCQELPGSVTYRAVAAESRVHRILEVAQEHDIVVMPTGSQDGFRRMFFGSLAEDVAVRLTKPMIIVRGGMESRTLEENV